MKEIAELETWQKIPSQRLKMAYRPGMTTKNSRLVT